MISGTCCRSSGICRVRLRAVLARARGWAKRLPVTLALAQCLRGPRNLHTLRRLQRELLYDDADRIDSWGPGQELEVERCCAPLLQWVRRWWVPTRAGTGPGTAGTGGGSYLQTG